MEGLLSTGPTLSSFFNFRKYKNKDRNSTNHGLFRKTFVCQESCQFSRQLQRVSGMFYILPTRCLMVSGRFHMVIDNIRKVSDGIRKVSDVV